MISPLFHECFSLSFVFCTLSLNVHTILCRIHLLLLPSQQTPQPHTHNQTVPSRSLSLPLLCSAPDQYHLQAGKRRPSFFFSLSCHLHSLHTAITTTAAVAVRTHTMAVFPAVSADWREGGKGERVTFQRQIFHSLMPELISLPAVAGGGGDGALPPSRGWMSGGGPRGRPPTPAPRQFRKRTQCANSVFPPSPSVRPSAPTTRRTFAAAAAASAVVVAPLMLLHFTGGVRSVSDFLGLSIAPAPAIVKCVYTHTAAAAARRLMTRRRRRRWSRSCTG